MSRDFDAERRSWNVDDRTFVLGGRTFVARENIRPDVIADFEDVTVARNGTDVSLRDLVAATDRAILEMLEGGDAVGGDGEPVPDSPRAWYLQLRADPSGLVNLDQLSGVAKWLVEQHTNRPTVPSPPSGNGRDGTGTTSTAISSSPVAAAPTGSPSESS